jgi:NDP-hexose C3-ketoreductase / dTDP-4-oxo-2-deoxy-alpha-D-pentos-2-ene 2,3-reductase
MDYTNLGRTGLRVSPLCLGTMNFGARATEPESFAIMDRALEHGIQFFDTANIYGARQDEPHRGEGRTEQIIGRWLEQGGGRRDTVVLATKVFGGMGPGPNDRGLSARHIVMACDASLRRLRTDWIDLYQMHHVSRSTPWEEIWQAMELLVAQGKVRYVGSSNFAGWHLAAAQEAANRRHFLGLVSEQCIYNLMAREVELEDPANVALAWLLSRPGVTAPIIGPRTGEHLDAALGALSITLDEATLTRLDELFPPIGQGGPGPEAWAW